MNITWDALFERIEGDPPEHLGGYSPGLLGQYFSGYEHALRFHSRQPIVGELGLWQFSQWFADHVSPGYAGVCLLQTDSDVEALELFFEFRKLARADISTLPLDDKDWNYESLSMLDLIQHPDAMRLRPAMYFGNSLWTLRLWAMWNGYVEAEKDIGIEASRDTRVFFEFSNWLGERYPFAEGKNWGKLFQFLALDVHAAALENFYDHLELFLEGGAPEDHTKRFQTFLDEAVASVKEHKRQSRKAEGHADDTS
jgi:hypothetical protein